MNVGQLIALLSEYPPDYDLMIEDRFEHCDCILNYNSTIEDVRESSKIVWLRGRQIVQDELKDQLIELSQNMSCRALRELLKNLFARRMK